jgi:hypothetical protein
MWRGVNDQVAGALGGAFADCASVSGDTSLPQLLDPRRCLVAGSIESSRWPNS